MTKEALEIIINYIVDQGIKAINDNTKETNLQIDYMGIFCKNNDEFEEMEYLLSTLGKPGDKTATKSGSTFLLKEPFDTPAGPLKVLKARRPDPTRSQRGAPDFKVKNYQAFKDTYFSNEKNSNFTLMLRKEYEMLELKGVDVLVYFPSKHFEMRQR